MDNLKKYNDVFQSCLNIEADVLGETLVYNSIPTWDSVGHMNLIANLEDAFDIMLETEDILDFSSYIKGKEILGKYDIKIES